MRQAREKSFFNNLPRIIAGDAGTDSIDEIFGSVFHFNIGGGPGGFDNVSYRCILDKRLKQMQN